MFLFQEIVKALPSELKVVDLSAVSFFLQFIGSYLILTLGFIVFFSCFCRIFVYKMLMNTKNGMGSLTLLQNFRFIFAKQILFGALCSYLIVKIFHQKEATYGLTEIYREKIKNSRLVANPGCYPTSILLPLIPLIKVMIS